MSANSDAAGLLRSMTALIRQRYQLGEVEAAAYVVDMPNRIRELESENTALRARAVPEVVWDGLLAEVGGFILEVRGGFVGWSWATWRNGAVVSNGGMTGGTKEQAKAHCEAAFLRLVGVQNG